jgi:urocanate hydratase
MNHPPTTEPNGVTPSGGSKMRVRAFRGTKLTCQGWHQEAALRMLMNSLDEEVAGRPEDLVVCGGTIKPARNWDCYHAIVRSLQSLKADESLLLQSRKMVGVFKTHAEAPRVLIAEGNPANLWPGGNQLPEAERLGPALFGQDAARSWTYVGSQQALHTAFETFAAIGRAHFGGELAGRLIVSGGMGSAGGTQPLAATLEGAAFLGIDVDAERITRRIRAGYCDFCVNSLDEALRILKNAVRQKQPVSVGLVGNCAEIIPELARRGVVPDVLSDLTGVRDLLNSYVPAGLSLEEAGALRRKNSEDYFKRACNSLAQHGRGMVELQKLGAVAFDFGNNLLRIALEHGGVQEVSGLPGFVTAYLQPAFCEGRVPLRWVALSGDVRDIRRADELLLELFPNDAMLARWIRLARKHVKFQGLPARVAWLGPEQRARYAKRLNTLVHKGELKAPIVIARDQMNCGSEILRCVESVGVNDTTKGRTVLNALLNLGSGASWVSLQDGGIEGTSVPCHRTQTAIADGAPGARKGLQRLLESDCGFNHLRGASGSR